jgi:sucrose-phosphate synthase
VALVEEAGLRGSVTAFSLEGQDAAAALYRWGVETGSVFCLPSLHEPFGLSLVEAMAVGLPAVATEHGGPREITDEGRAGILADPADPSQLAAALAGLLRDRRAWEHYAAVGRERVLAHYSWARAAQSYAELAAEIASGARTGDAAYPLPLFVREPAPAELPRLESWELSTSDSLRARIAAG